MRTNAHGGTLGPTSSHPYLLAGQDSELERLRLQSRVWEASGRRLLDQIGDRRGARVVDVGCGAMGWLRLLSEWVGPEGQVVGTDIDDSMLAAAAQFVTSEELNNVVLVKDDLFASELEPSSFDLVHSRFEIGPLGHGSEQMATYLRLVRPGGTVVLEDVDAESWHFVPSAPALEALIPLLKEAFRKAGGNPDAPAEHLALFRRAGIEPKVRAEVQALPPGHPYLRLPLDFLTALKGLLLAIVKAVELERLEQEGERELQNRERWGITFTLFQSFGQRPHVT